MITLHILCVNCHFVLLESVGASPIMAHAKSEIKEMVSISNALVINIGTLDEYWSESMLIAAEEAKANKTITKGGDSTAESNEAINAAKYLVKNYQSVVCISGATDIIIDNKETYFVENGHPLMTNTIISLSIISRDF